MPRPARHPHPTIVGLGPSLNHRKFDRTIMAAIDRSSLDGRADYIHYGRFRVEYNLCDEGRNMDEHGSGASCGDAKGRPRRAAS